MSKNNNRSSPRMASKASETLRDPGASQVAKSLAASVLSQRAAERQTGARLEETAARVLRAEKYSAETKEFAASVLSQSNKER